MTTVTFGGLTFDCATADSDGAVWNWTRLDGWEPPEPRTDLLTPAGRDGQIPGEWRHNGRALVFAGTASLLYGTRPWSTEYWKAFNRLAAGSNLVDGTGLLVVGEPVPKQITVKLEGRPRMRPFQGKMAVLEFEIPLIAPDWRKYGTTPQAVTSSPVTNAGNVRATPVVVITGASTNPRITNTTDDAKFVEVTTSLAGGQTLTLDFENHTATHSADGNVDALVVPGSRWWDLAVGANVVTLTGGGTYSVNFSPAFL